MLELESDSLTEIFTAFGRKQASSEQVAHEAVTQVREHLKSGTPVGSRQTVDLTCETIRLVWKLIHGKDGPSWLPKRDSQGRFERVTVKLTPLA